MKNRKLEILAVVTILAILLVPWRRHSFPIPVVGMRLDVDHEQKRALAREKEFAPRLAQAAARLKHMDAELQKGRETLRIFEGNVAAAKPVTPKMSQVFSQLNNH